MLGGETAGQKKEKIQQKLPHAAATTGNNTHTLTQKSKCIRPADAPASPWAAPGPG